MAKGSPFTRLCQAAARATGPVRADLHVHSTASDGTYTPSQVVGYARQAGVVAVALTDHDTLAGWPELADAAARFGGLVLEVIPGVEITAGFRGREVHLLGLYVRPDHPGLTATLARLCARRRERFRDFVRVLAADGHHVPEHLVSNAEAVSASLGRRHVADLAVAAGLAAARQEAFGRFVHPAVGRVTPKELLPVADAIALVHAAGGVASLAHPPPAFGDDEFTELAALGLDALEARYPWGRSSPGGRLREAAGRLGLLTSGGSDCHGHDPAHRRIGCVGVTPAELAALRERAGSRGSAAAAAGAGG